MSRFSTLALIGALFVCVPSLSAQTAPPSSSLAAPTRVFGPSGVRREAGNWLFNDSIFVAEGVNATSPGAPLFLPDLRRDRKAKLPFFKTTPTRGALNFATLPLPTLRQMSAPGFDFAALQAQLTAQIGAASRSTAWYAGWSLPTGNGPALSKAAIAPILKRLRAVLDAVAPTSALILEVNAATEPLQAIADIDAAAPSCDAVVLRVDAFDERDLWPLKMARRVAEEQKGYDLPILVAPAMPDISSPRLRQEWEARLAEFWMGGASGFLLPDALVPSWEATVRRNAGLFAGAVTLEDAAILPSLNPKTLQIFAALRAAGRIPLAGRLSDDDDKGESLFVVLDDATSLETLNRLEKTARAGGAIYLEGVPNLANKAIADKMALLTSTSIEVLPAPKNEVLTLDDLWLFGTARGREFSVVQRVKWTPKTTLAAQTRVKKGEASPFPTSAAKLASDANGLLLAPLGRGQVLWLAHTPLSSTDDATRRTFYAAIAGSLQASLASWKWASTEDETRGAGSLRAALRASSSGTPILALFNAGDADANIALSARSDAPVALDLGNEKELAATVVGYSSTINVQIPAHGWRWFAFGKTRVALDKERLAPRPKARNR